jgi:cytochrome c peroxidase
MRHAIAFVTIVLATSPTLAGSLEVQARGLFKPLPARFDSAENPITAEKVALGKLLFYDVRLSKNHDVSCNSCHDLGRYGVDGQPFSTGHKKQLGGRNSPSVYNAGDSVAQFWDGRAVSLEEQAKGPMLNPVEMAMTDGDAVAAIVTSVPGYAPLFAKAFPDQATPITVDTIAKAIGAFERTLVTPSRFDRYLAGEDAALTASEKVGLQRFISSGCAACHNGEGVGGGMFQKLGLVEPLTDLKDEGRSAFTKNAADRFHFKVASLRNVAKTGPYLHDARFTSLDQTISFMARHQLGKKLTADTVTSIVGFLKSLTGELPQGAVTAPTPLASGPLTPKPDPN